MQSTVQERCLAERLRPRLAVEERFRLAGGKIKTKSFFRQNEKRIVAPLLKAGLKVLGLYQRGKEEALSPVVSEVTMQFADLPRAFDGFRILHLSDLHIDGFEGLTESLIRTLDRVEADICLITGDYRFEDEGPCDELYRCMRKLLPHINAKGGIYGILGNHDEAAIALELEEMGVCMLENEAAEIRRGRDAIWIAGIDDDYDYQCDDLPGAMAEVPNGAFTALMAHTPDLYSQAAELGVDLYLCGHTHGGQVRVPGIGALRSNARCPRAYIYRHWRHEKMQGYTSAGIGCSSLPVRLNCPPELVFITLRSI